MRRPHHPGLALPPPTAAPAASPPKQWPPQRWPSPPRFGGRLAPGLALAFTLWLALAAASPALAASCCGGSSEGTLILPKTGNWMVNYGLSWEEYDGFWDGTGRWVADPAGSALNQYRISLGMAWRLSPNWQTSVSLPYVMNGNRYPNHTTSTQGLGDASVGLLYEAFDTAMCVYKVETLADLRPAVYMGLGLTLPTGESPYDKVALSEEVTGRGFYRLDAQLIVDKTVYPWSLQMKASYGVHMQRPVNREYGRYVEPYQKKLGGRSTASLGAGYTWFLDNMDTLVATATYSRLDESAAQINGAPDPSTEISRQSLGLSLAWSEMAAAWSYSAGYAQDIRQHGYGKNFPTTNTLTLGARYVFD